MRTHPFSSPADNVYVEIKRRAKDAILQMIEREREGSRWTAR